MKVIRYIVFILLAVGCSLSVTAQIDGDDEVLDYSVPREYTLGPIVVSGTKYLDTDILISLSGLSPGDQISIPGDEISNALRNLWNQKLFTDVAIYILKTEGDYVFLEIAVKERPRLGGFQFFGVKKGDHEDLRDKIKLIKGRVVTENTKVTTANIIKNHYYEKGYLNTKVTIVEVPDTAMQNSVKLHIIIDKGKKVKIENIEFYHNEKVSSRKLKGLMKNTNEKVKVELGELLSRKEIKEDLPDSVTVNGILENLAPSRTLDYIGDKANLNIFKGSKFIKEEYKTDKEAIIAHYNSKGYKDARIVRDTVYDSGENNLSIELYIYEGIQYHFRDIVWKGNTKYTDEQLNRILNIQKGAIYDQTLLEERLFMSPASNDVSSLYMDDGYLFFQITPVEVAVEEDSIDLEIRIYEGPQATINEVRIYGNTKTKEYVIRREIRTLPGNKFSRSDLIRSQREIIALGYFDPEGMEVIPIPNPANGTVDIEYHVVEQPSDQLELSAGWGGRGRGVVGTLGVSFTNFSIQNMFKKGTWSPLPTGDGQRFSIRAQTNGKVFQSYNVSFTEPWLGGKKPNSFTVSYFHQRFADLDREGRIEGRQITNGATIGIGTRLKWPDDYFTFQALLNFESFRLDNWPTNTFIIRDGTANNLNLQFVLARDSRLGQQTYPTGGSFFSLSLQITPPYSAISGKDLKDAPDNEKYQWIEYHKWRFNAEWYTSLTKSKKNPLVLKIGAKFGFLGFYNPDIGYSPFERFELGGDGISNVSFIGRDIIALRGYDVITPSVGSPFFNKFTMELRYPFSTNPSSTIYALAFMEAGNYWMDIKDYNPFNVRRSAGLGIRVFLPMFGLLGFDYGIGFDKNLPNTNNFGNYLSSYGKFSIILGFEPE